MLNLFFRCLLLCSGFLSLNAALALPLSSVINASSELVSSETNNYQQDTLIAHHQLGDNQYAVNLYQSKTELTIAEYRDITNNIYVIQFASQHFLANKIECVLRQKYLPFIPLLSEPLSTHKI